MYIYIFICIYMHVYVCVYTNRVYKYTLFVLPLWRTLTSIPCGPFLHLQSESLQTVFIIISPFPPSQTPSVLFLRLLWLHWAYSNDPGYLLISILVALSHLQSLFWHIRQYSQLLWIRMWTSWDSSFIIQTPTNGIPCLAVKCLLSEVFLWFWNACICFATVGRLYSLSFNSYSPLLEAVLGPLTSS